MSVGGEGAQGASEDISERNERFQFKLPRRLEVERPCLAVQLPTKDRNSFFITFSTVLVAKVSHMIFVLWLTPFQEVGWHSGLEQQAQGNVYV